MTQNAHPLDKSSPKSEKKLKDTAPPPLPFASHIPEEKNKKKRDPTTVEDMQQMVLEMKRQQEEIHQTLDEVYRVTGWTPQSVKTHLENPNNFTEKQWENMQKERKKFMNAVKTPSDLKREEEQAKIAPVTQAEAPHDPKIAKERRSKTIASRRKWLPMR